MWKNSGMKTTKMVKIKATNENEERYNKIWTKRKAKNARKSVPVFGSRTPTAIECQMSRSKRRIIIGESRMLKLRSKMTQKINLKRIENDTKYKISKK